MEQTECSEMSAYKIEDAGGSLKRKNTTIIKSFSKTELFQRTCGPLDCQTWHFLSSFLGATWSNAGIKLAP